MLTSTPGSYRTGFFQSHHHLKIFSWWSLYCSQFIAVSMPADPEQWMKLWECRVCFVCFFFFNTCQVLICCFSFSGNYPQALEDFQECLKLQVKHLDSDSRLLAETRYQLGVTYSLNTQYSEAIESLKSSISIIKNRLGKHQLLEWN